MTKTVLTVDNSRMMREMLAMVLREAGFNVLQAEDGIEGLKVLEDADPDVIITDINMPNLDGYGFIEGVRRDRRHRSRPILVLSTESDPDKKGRARAAGATGWIVKPFKAEFADRRHPSRRRLEGPRP